MLYEVFKFNKDIAKYCSKEQLKVEAELVYEEERKKMEDVDIYVKYINVIKQIAAKKEHRITEEDIEILKISNDICTKAGNTIVNKSLEEAGYKESGKLGLLVKIRPFFKDKLF